MVKGKWKIYHGKRKMENKIPTIVGTTVLHCSTVLFTSIVAALGTSPAYAQSHYQVG